MRAALRHAILVMVLGATALNSWVAWSRIAPARGAFAAALATPVATTSSSMWDQLSTAGAPGAVAEARSALAQVKQRETTRGVGAEIVILTVGGAAFILAGASRRKTETRA